MEFWASSSASRRAATCDDDEALDRRLASKASVLFVELDSSHQNELVFPELRCFEKSMFWNSKHQGCECQRLRTCRQNVCAPVSRILPRRTRDRASLGEKKRRVVFESGS